MGAIGRFSIEYGARLTCDNKLKHPSLRLLLPILRTWGRSTAYYLSMIPDDAPYAYNERANVSVLAASAWKCKAIALEEYVTEKNGRTKEMADKEKRKKSGRADLYISTGRDEFHIEAKQYWMHATMKPETLKRRLETGIEKAKDAAQEAIHSSKRLGCAFFVPIFEREHFPQYRPQANSLIRSLITDYVKNNGAQADIWAWCFPKASRFYIDHYQQRKRFCPGVIVAMKTAKHFYSKFYA